MRPRCEPFWAIASRLFKPRQDQKSQIRGVVLSLIAARPAVLTLAVGSGIALDQASFVSGAEGGVRILVCCYLLTGIYLILTLLRVRTTFNLMLQIVTDVLLITGLVSITGGPSSQYVLLYFILILYASMCLSFRGALTAAALSSVGYSLTLWPHVFPWHVPPLGYEGTETALKIVFHGVLFMTVGALGGFLARRAEQQDRRLIDATDELQRIKLSTDVILQSIGSGIMSIDAEGRIVHFNKAASNILGLDPGLARGKHFDAVLGPGMSAVGQLLRRGLEEGLTASRGELEITSGNGRKVPLGINTSLVATEAGKRAGVIALCQDLTEVKKAEEKVKRQETLAALGQFSAGIAHEIRNCLSPIIGSVELLKKELSLEGDSQKLMDLVLKEADRLDVFLGEVLFYARAKPLDLKLVDLRQLIDETVEIVRRHPAHSPSKTLLCRFQSPETYARLDAEQMKRVFVNLAVNALEAIEGHGQLTIRTYAEQERIRGSSKPGAFIVIEFEDDGVGIPAESLKRVLEPFYSTKGSGTGLGLSIAQRVVERHNGRIAIESKPNKGTKVSIHIPHFVADSIDTTCLTEKAA